MFLVVVWLHKRFPFVLNTWLAKIITVPTSRACSRLGSYHWILAVVAMLFNLIGYPNRSLFIFSRYSSMICKNVTCKSGEIGLDKHTKRKKRIQILWIEKDIIQVLRISDLCWPILLDTGGWISKCPLFYLQFENLLLSLILLVGCCFSRLRAVAELRHGDLFHSANIVSRLAGISTTIVISHVFCFAHKVYISHVYFSFPTFIYTVKYLNHCKITLCCSIEFDRDDELFATAGVSRRIKIFEFSSVSVGKRVIELSCEVHSSSSL